MKDVGIIWSILRPIGIFMPILVIWYIFSPFWYVAPRKIWQPWYELQIEWMKNF
jgi:hypothetical protein